MDFKIVGLLLVILIYIITIIYYIQHRNKIKDLDQFINEDRMEYSRMFYLEERILKSLNIKPGKIKPVLWTIRIIVFGAIGVLLYMLRGVALTLVGGLAVTLIFDDLYKKAVHDSGITNVSIVTNFLNYFIPHINSGNSADQSLLAYISYSGLEPLEEFYQRRGEPGYEIPTEIKQIVDIWDIAKYNEEKGISDYTYILNEISKDMSQKQTYYNSFVSRISEIKPIEISYYIGVPAMIFMSFSQTYDFWMGVGGAICSVVILILFTVFKFLIYKLQKSTIETIF